MDNSQDEVTKMALKYIRCLTLFTLREMQIKITLRQHFSSMRLENI